MGAMDRKSKQKDHTFLQEIKMPPFLKEFLTTVFLKNPAKIKGRLLTNPK